MRTRKLTQFILLLMILFVLVGCNKLPALSHSSDLSARFVKTSGTRFVLNGKPFFVAGTNNHYLGWATHAEVDSMLQFAKDSHYNVVRTILHSVIGSLDGTKKTIWNWQNPADVSNMGMRGVYLLYWDTTKDTWAINDSSETGLGRWDYVIWKAGKLGLKLDISLMDYWEWAGGSQQVLAWYGSTDRYFFFYEDPRVKDFYRQWVSHVMNRTNTLTGIKYKDDPTIFAWDLMNEPEIGGIFSAQNWYQEMATYIKSVDPNHLVTTGSEGFYDGYSIGSDPDTEALKAPAIDFQVWHVYTNYHNVTPQGGIALINRHCASAEKGGKPVLLQEFGSPAATSADKLARRDTYRSWLTTIYNNPNCAGWLYWRLEGKVKQAPTTPFPSAENDPGQSPDGWPPDNGETFSIYPETNPDSTFYDPSYQMFKEQAAQLITKNK